MTPDEFTAIDIEITPERQDLVVETYVRRTLRPESICTFNTDRANGVSVSDALYHAVFNEFVIEAFLDQIASAEAATTTPSQDN